MNPNQAVGYPVVRLPEELRMHPALEGLGLPKIESEIDDATKLKGLSISEPISITKDGIVLGGFGRWRLALLEGTREIECIEYPLSKEHAVQFLLSHFKPRRGWNAFLRIQVALTLEPALRRQALDNMRVGGKFKGLANLPEAQCLDVRRRIAEIAAVGERNVNNVKNVLHTGHPRLIAALREGTLTINAAVQLCKFPRPEQLERLIRRREERETDKVIRRSISRSSGQPASPDTISILEALREQESRQPGSVVMRSSRCQQTIIVIGQDLLPNLNSHEESQPT